MSSLDRLVAAADPGAGSSSMPSSLRGARYGEDRIHLLVRDPRQVLVVWELSPATLDAAAAAATAAGAPLRIAVRVERERVAGVPPEAVATADLPDALGGEGWYLDVPPRAGRCRAQIGVALPAGFYVLLTSRWVATPPAGPCAEAGSWPLRAEGRAWAARAWDRADRPGAERSDPGSSVRFLPPLEEKA